MRTYGQRPTVQDGKGYVGNGRTVHWIKDGRPICNSGYSSLGRSHKRHPKIIMCIAEVTCKKCKAMQEKDQ